MRRALIAACLAAATFLSAAPSGAAESPPEERPPEEMAREGVELLMRALRGFLDAVPQYGLPRIEENGDIVIPRLRPKEVPEEEREETEETQQL